MKPVKKFNSSCSKKSISYWGSFYLETICINCKDTVTPYLTYLVSYICIILNIIPSKINLFIVVLKPLVSFLVNQGQTRLTKEGQSTCLRIYLRGGLL